MSLYESLLRPIAFRLDPEWVHERGLKLISRGLVSGKRIEDPRLRQTLFGVDFPNPLGLAAGFDKNGLALDHWHQLGFGFVEAGTVTAHPQPGNPKPRMFRVPEVQGVLNRLGFNNRGAAALAERLKAAKPQIPVGINLGKSKITPLEEAAQDYATSFQALHAYGAYFVVNVSSPNTPGLRDLQEKGALREIFAAIKAIDANRPLFVKVAPDLTWEALDQVVEVALEANLTGIIATNTTISREALPPGHKLREEAGGLSGAPVRERAQEVMAHLYRSVPRETILIGVGGIFTGDDLYARIAAGAHLCQLYTGFIYGGPATVPKALKGLVARMEREGVKSSAELRGSLQ